MRREPLDERVRLYARPRRDAREQIERLLEKPEAPPERQRQSDPRAVGHGIQQRDVQACAAVV